MRTQSSPSFQAPLGPSVFEALDRARASLTEARMAELATERYSAAHIAALRTAAAVLAARTGPTVRRGRRDAWTLLARVAPELAEWAAFFAAGAGKRAAAEAGLPRAVTDRDADDLVRDVERFIAVVEAMLELPHQPSLPHQSERADSDQLGPAGLRIHGPGAAA